MGKKKGLQFFNILVLEKIRVAIVNGLAYGGLKLNQDYRLSKANENRMVFMIEVMSKATTEARAKKALKHTLRHMPKFKNTTAFIEMKIDSEYQHLLKLEATKFSV